MSTAVTTKQGGAVSAEVRVEAGLQAMLEKFRSLLPAEEEADRFCRVAINALQDGRLQMCAQTPEGRQSIYNECQAAATDGILLDKREGFLNVYRSKVKLAGGGEDWREVAKYVPMYQGLLKLLYNSGLFSDIKCNLVKEGDAFAVSPLGAVPVLHEYPEDPFVRGKTRGVYAVGQYKDGRWTNPEVMSAADVERIRAMSPAKDKDAWTKHWDEMARKTVLRRFSKWVPKSAALNRFHSAVIRGDDLNTIEGTVITQAALPAPARKLPAAQALMPPPKEAEKPAPEKEAPPKTTKAAAKKKEPAPPPPDDDMGGLDDRSGGGSVWDNDESDV